MSDIAAPEFNTEADALLAGIGESGAGVVSAPEPVVTTPNAGVAPEGQPGGDAAPGGQAAPKAPAPAPTSPVSAPQPGIAIGKSVRLVPVDAIDVAAAEIKKSNPGLSFHESVDQARQKLGIQPVVTPAPAAPAPAPTETPAAELTPALARMEAIATEIGELNPIIDAAEIQQLQLEAMRLQPVAVKEQATLQLQQLMQDQASLTAEQQEAEAAIARSWQSATTTFPTLAHDNSPLRDAYEDRMEELRQSTNPSDLAILEHPECEVLVASMCAARLGASAFAPAAVAQPGGNPNAPVQGSPAPHTPLPTASPRSVLPVVPGFASGDHTQLAGLRPADPNADLQTRLAAARSPLEEADMLMDSISGGNGPRSGAPFFMS
jgi:hypothetical protein